MIFELFACPGAGKTYAINIIHPGTRETSKHSGRTPKDVLLAMVKKMILISPYSYRVRSDISKLLKKKKTEYHPIYKPVPINDFIKNISMLAAVYKYKQGDIFMDEGIVHRVITMCINYDLGLSVCSHMIKQLKYVLDDVNVVYLDVTEEDCLKSIRDRNRHEVSIDELHDEELKCFVSQYQKYCNYICDEFKFSRMSRDRVKNWKDYIRSEDS